MAFTHYTPTAQRFYGVASSFVNGIPIQTEIASEDYSGSDTIGSPVVSSNTIEYDAATSYDSNGSYESQDEIGTTTGLYQLNADEYSQGNSYSASKILSLTYNYISSYSSESFHEGSTSSYGNQATGTDANYKAGGGGGITASSFGTSETKFDSTWNSYTSSYDDSGSSSESYTIATEDDEGVTGVSNVVNTGSSVSYSYIEYGETITRSAGNSGVRSTSISSSSGYTTVNNRTVIPPQSNETVTGTTNEVYRNEPKTTIATALSTRTQNSNYPPSVTTSTEVSYTSYSSNLIETESSSYSVKTTTRSFGNNYTFERSSQVYTTETQALTERIGRGYGISTIHGGAGFISGGVTLDNGAITGASYGSTFSAPLVSQPTDFNSWSSQRLTASLETATLTVWEQTYESDDVVNTLIGASSVLSIITTTSSELTETVDFGRLTSSAKVFTDRTTADRYSQEGNTAGVSFYSTTSSYANKRYTTFFGYNSITFNSSKSYIGIDGFSTFTWLTSVLSDTSFQTYINAGGATDSVSTRVTAFETSGTTQRKAQSATDTGLITSDFSDKLITYDKGLQGGVQYEKSSDVSGAVRSTRSITIADQVITSTTYTSPAATINITGNSAESSSYTFSAGLALGLELKLNRYLTYFPHERYGDIVSSIDSMQYSYSDEGIGSSIIRFSSTGIYSTTNITQNTDTTFTGPANSATSRNTQSFFSELFGIIKPGLGAVYEEGQRTALKISKFNDAFEPPNIILGGQKFTDKVGIYEYSTNRPPYSFYAFGSSDSSLITQANGDIITGSNEQRTISIPAKSVIFNPLSTFLRVGGFAQTYDRNQIEDFAYYSSYYYYYGYGY